MNKKTICSIIRIIEMIIAFAVLSQVYRIGLLGYFMVAITGIVWSVTSAIEHTESK